MTRIAINAKPERNAALFKQWRAGRKRAELASEFKISKSRIYAICSEMERRRVRAAYKKAERARAKAAGTQPRFSAHHQSVWEATGKLIPGWT